MAESAAASSYPSHSTKPRPTSSVLWVRVSALVLIGAASVSYPPLSVPAVVVTLLLGLTFPDGDGERGLRRAAIGIAALGAAVGLVRFAMSGAMLGIVESG